MSAARSATRGCLPAYSVLQPGERNEEKRRQDEAQQRVDPDQGDVKAAEAETSPEDAERAVSFQGKCSCNRERPGQTRCKIAVGRDASQRAHGHTAAAGP